MNTITRKNYQDALITVSKGIRLSGYSRDTMSVINLCAQYVRQSVESIEQLTPGTWEVASMALVIARERNRPGERYAIDYEQGAIRLGLQKKFSDIQTGDVGYWGVPAKFGHTAIAIELDNKMYWLENISSEYRPKSKTLFPSVTDANGGKTIGKIMLTPVGDMAVPRTLINPTKNIRDQKEVTVIPVINTALLQDRTGATVIIIKNGAEQVVGTLEKATGVVNKLFIKVK